MKKHIKVLMLILLIVVLIIIGIFVAKKHYKKGISDVEPSGDITIVPTMQDKITTDSSWCATFQLVWNDMKNEVVKQDIIFTPQEKFADNLNKEEFTEDMLSEEYYFKKFGLKTLQLKKDIEKGVKEKFNQTSDILDKFDWSEDGLTEPNTDRYFFYTMLYREFKFLKKFDKLPTGKFANKYENVEYFGINSDTKDDVREQVDVLYYNSQDDFAVLLNTKSDDEVILCKNPKGTNFKEIYNNMNKNSENYMGSNTFKEIDQLKVPKIEFNKEKDYVELENKTFSSADNRSFEIVKAIQTIKFSLDETGGKIKSEAAIDMWETACANPNDKKEEPRYFYLDDTFAMFLREKGKDLPYFATRIEDITKFQ